MAEKMRPGSNFHEAMIMTVWLPANCTVLTAWNGKTSGQLAGPKPASNPKFRGIEKAPY